MAEPNESQNKGESIYPIINRDSTDRRTSDRRAGQVPLDEDSIDKRVAASNRRSEQERRQKRPGYIVQIVVDTFKEDPFYVETRKGIGYGGN